MLSKGWETCQKRQVREPPEEAPLAQLSQYEHQNEQG